MEPSMEAVLKQHLDADTIPGALLSLLFWPQGVWITIWVSSQ